MTHGERDFRVMEYVTLTKDPRTGLVVATGSTGQVADILQRSNAEVPEVLTARAAPTTGVSPLVRKVVVRAWVTWPPSAGATGAEAEPVTQLGDTTQMLSRAAARILHARNHAERTLTSSAPSATTPAPQPSAPASRRH